MRRPILTVTMTILLTAVGFLLTPSIAQAVTLQELIDLNRAGVGEDVLLALIEVDQRVFPIDPETLNKLKQAGLSERIIVAIVRSGRSPLAQPEPPAPVPTTATVPPPDPQPDVIYAQPREREIVREVMVPVPVYVAVGSVYSGRRHSRPYIAPGIDVFPSPFNTFPPTAAEKRQTQPRKPAEPVYWGWGGKLRPDAWKPR